MANTRDSGVIRVDTTASFTGPISIKGIKYVGSGSAATAITNVNSTDPLWESGAGLTGFDDVEIHASEGITVTVTDSGVAYIYLNR